MARGLNANATRGANRRKMSATALTAYERWLAEQIMVHDDFPSLSAAIANIILSEGRRRGLTKDKYRAHQAAQAVPVGDA